MTGGVPMADHQVRGGLKRVEARGEAASRRRAEDALRDILPSQNAGAGGGHTRERSVLSFEFPVNKSFLSQGDHPITFRNWSYGRLVGVIGAIDHASQPVRVVSVSGIEMEARIRHSSTRGQDYYQLNCKDYEITEGLTKGQVVHVELIDTGGRPEVRLHTTTP